MFSKLIYIVYLDYYVNVMPRSMFGRSRQDEILFNEKWQQFRGVSVSSSLTVTAQIIEMKISEYTEFTQK